jgi:hypothetical protein
MKNGFFAYSSQPPHCGDVLLLTTTDRFIKRELERQIDASHFEDSLSAAKLSPVAKELHPGVSFQRSALERSPAALRP